MGVPDSRATTDRTGGDDSRPDRQPPDSPSSSRGRLPLGRLSTGAITDYALPVIGLLAVIALSVGVIVRLNVHDPAPRAAAETAVPASAPPTPAPDPCRDNTLPRRVVVSVGSQHMWLCQAANVYADSPVTTGSVDLGDGTPLGTWQIQSRETDRYLWGPDYRVFVHYWLPYFEDIGFHDSSWQKFPYGDLNMYKRFGSHGCVHVPAEMMSGLYTWALEGTTVTVTA
ncbi:hypothetical protein GCM10027169_13770 [Gordonia jinhuaensis]|uniref:L,D-TPase catalytic domain-containing protein n=1 Tax=Gordonia jinhuaensis TaxID=1517702 RepID=A0A916T0I6_9ACTN|nr:hypothetical protein GCM10011489_09110 [Gordonia jinhuaensis]